MEQFTFMQACRHYFGTLPGQTAMQFGKEVQALTVEDKKEIAKELVEKHEYNIVPMPA